MRRSDLIATHLLLLACLVSTRADCADKPLRGESEQLKVVLMKMEDPEVIAYKISFALKITNLSAETIVIGSSPVFVKSIQSRDEDGVWSNLNQMSSYDVCGQQTSLQHLARVYCLPEMRGGAILDRLVQRVRQRRDAT